MTIDIVPCTTADAANALVPSVPSAPSVAAPSEASEAAPSEAPAESPPAPVSTEPTEAVTQPLAGAAPELKRRGRKPGSKNKPKDPEETADSRPPTKRSRRENT